jgi:DNA-directed RNA polymerase subunit RPC12/RpoP
MSYKCSHCGATLSLRVDEINGNSKYLFCDDCLEKMLREIFCKDLTDEDVKSNKYFEKKEDTPDDSHNIHVL